MAKIHVKKTIQKKKKKLVISTKDSEALFQRGYVDRSIVHKATTMSKEEFAKHQVGMEKKWPVPDYMQGEHGSMKFKDETFETITRWTAKTRIAYRPHAKSPGSKSHLRYERYSQAKTVGQALSLGSYPADWCWDFERGFIKVLGGPVREEPVDISKGDESNVTDVDRAINVWYQRELAKMLGMAVKDITATAGWGESINQRALRLLAQKECSERLEAADREGRAITDEEVLATLKRWPFHRNPWRKNVMQPGKTWVFSDTLGLLRDRAGDVHLTAPTRRYPQVAELLARWLMDRLPEEAKKFSFTSMNVNCNYAAAIHRDNGNFGPSFIKAFGDFSGGRLNYWPEDAGGDLKQLPQNERVSFDLKRHLALFNGNCAHEVTPFQGARYSIVYFTVGCHAEGSTKDRQLLERLSFPYPSANVNPYAFLRPPRGHRRSGRGLAAIARASPKARELQAYHSFDVAAMRLKGCRRAKSAAEAKRVAARRVKPENAKSFYNQDQRRRKAMQEQEADAEY
mmetsp:Transcript_26227/g.51354  ORF Transcript_26227/g.51354 Transcript_26227/m.51354 type:complete len:514 (+) Transcript_26227:62-1603(+)